MKNILSIILLGVLTSCACTSNVSAVHLLFIAQETIPDNTEIVLTRGKATYLDSLGQKIIRIDLEPLLGGSNYFLGIEFNKVIPDDYPRVQFVQDGQAVTAYTPI